MLLGLLWVGCSDPPIFSQIEGITVISQTPGGTSNLVLEGEPLLKATDCLYRTEEIEQAESKTELLQEILLLEVKDRLGDRMFEMYTDENLKGNKKYFRNRCIFKTIRH
jgi:hypothetical protein